MTLWYGRDCDNEPTGWKCVFRSFCHDPASLLLNAMQYILFNSGLLKKNTDLYNKNISWR